jgi:hemerythrin-like domain-containing protein
MNAIDLLKEDHDVVDALFKEAESETPSRQEEIFKKIKGELDTHAHIEETIFYPTLLAKGDKALVDIVREGLEEHKQIKMFLGELERKSSKDPEYEAMITVLIEDTRHHVDEEENEMFPLVNDKFTKTALEKLGNELEAEKRNFLKTNDIKPETREKALGPLSRLVRAITGGNGQDKETAPSARKTAKPARGKSGGKSSTAKSANGKSAGTSAKASAKTKKGTKAKARSGSKTSATSPKEKKTVSRSTSPKASTKNSTKKKTTSRSTAAKPSTKKKPASRTAAASSTTRKKSTISRSKVSSAKRAGR